MLISILFNLEEGHKLFEYPIIQDAYPIYSAAQHLNAVKHPSLVNAPFFDQIGSM